jgi:hypothetical protein
MTGIYSQPIQYPTQPENAMRARNGERPPCFSRPEYPETVEVQDGWTAAGRRRMVEIPNPMTKGCKSWAVREPDPNRPGDSGEDPAVESIPAREGWRCLGCRHLPPDPRVIACAERINGT